MNISTNSSRMMILLSAWLWMMVGGGIAYAIEVEEIQLMTPIEGIATSGRGQAAVKPEETYVRRIGSVRLYSDALLPVPPGGIGRAAGNTTFAKKRLGLEIFSGFKVDIEVAAEARPDGETLALHGRKEGKGLSTFSLTITPEAYLIIYDDPDSTKRYRIVGDTETGDGLVTEIDLKLMPATLDSPVLIPPSE